MSDLVTILEPEIVKTIASLNEAKFTPDPIAGPHFSRIVSLISSAYKRHGFILERAILEYLKLQPDLTVWNDDAFQIPDAADHLVQSVLSDPTSISDSNMKYSSGSRTVQVDVIVFNKTDRSVKAYEIKRGSGYHDAGKRRSMLRDSLCVNLLLKDYARQKGHEARSANSHVVFYYGSLSVDPPIGITGADLDSHFGLPPVEEVETINNLFRTRLFEILTSG